MSDPQEPTRVLAVAAHPDDIEFGCAGTIAVWRDQGAEVRYVIVTDGSTGTRDPALAGEPLAKIRSRETLAAAAAVGVTDVRFLGYRDGYVEYTLDLRRDIAREFRAFRPQRLMTMDVDPIIGDFFINHPDHRAVGQATLDVTLTAGTTPGHFPELLAEGLEPWRELKEIWIMGPAGGETPVDITTGLDRKIEALRAHASQMGEWDVGSAIRGWAAETGKAHGLPAAETFRVIRPFGTG